VNDPSAPPPGAIGAHRDYYGRPILKPPVWKPELPWYFWTGGIAGGSSLLGLAAEAAGNQALARSARRAAAVGAVVSPALLVADLGRPERFLNMLRVFRPTSPLSMGAWLLVGYVPAAAGAALLGELGWLRPVQRTASVAAAVGGLPMITYTAVLISNTAIPVWHEARRELPFVFAGSAAAAAAGAALVLTPVGHAGPARRLGLLGAAMEQAAERAMERRLGPLARPYTEGPAGRYSKAARALTRTGAVVTALAGRRRYGAVAGGALLLAGSLCQRWAVFRAGWQSAEDPQYVVRLQRDRLARGQGAGT
jgi:hypothetical protein